MRVEQIRDKFVEFFKGRGHVLLPASSLIPTDPTVLFTTAGMQQFKEWFVDPKLAKHKRVVTIQPCFRTSDIDEVGDATHLTYFEMLGHFSFGDYFKAEAIEWGWQFITNELKVNKLRVRATYFGGEGELDADNESLEILKQFLPEDRIDAKDKADNFWGPTGEEGPCGPNIEFWVNGVEIWNSVFNQYYYKAGKYEPLSTSGVDMGGGLERIAMVVQGVDNVFETDELAKLMAKIPAGDLRSRRIIADHIRAIDGLVKDGVLPSNKAQGAVLRRLMRRVITHNRLISAPEELITKLVDVKARKVVKEEQEKFSKSLKTAMGVYARIVEKASRQARGKKTLRAQDVFLLQESYGLPLEITRELAHKDDYAIDEAGFNKLMQEHQQKSRVGVEKKFKGGLVEITPETTRLHTAHHLLLAALRKVLGDHVVQRGSNITSERLRIDFSHPRGVNREEIKKVEQFVSQWIKDDLPVTHEEMSLDEAYKKGALGEFGAAYPKEVSVYRIGQPPVSIEICGGPHVTKTSEIGNFKITKEESSGAGIRRVRAVVS